MANFNRYQTASEIVNVAATEVGLTPVSNVFGSTDPAFVQLRTLLTTCGRELLTAHTWQEFQREGTVAIQYGNSGPYDPPADYEKLLSDVTWDRNTAFPAYGSLTPQEWQRYKSALYGTANILNIAYRIKDRGFYFHPQVPAGSGTYRTIYFEYLSRAWVESSSSTEKDYVDANDDVVYYNGTMIIKRLKLAFLAAKGFDTTTAADEFKASFDFAVSSDLPATTLRLARPSSPRYIDKSNVPATGYGT